ncbi:hypothetical protein B566_EDAN015366 [Ephemera danica]|nr:hypothetical protein B566_EDAN015366 [Ephemera danica]
MTALHLAAKSGNMEACALLLTEHSSATPRALLDAQDDGGWTALVYLMTKRADPLIRDAEQNIALHWSTFAGSVDISELLLNYGSDENYECVLLLLARGARVDARNVAGDRPLDCCPHPRTDCYTAINMNVQLQNLLTSNCLCAHLSMRCWYDEEGRLLPDFNFGDPPLLFECNVGCACNRITCNNRVVQHGPTAREDDSYLFDLDNRDGETFCIDARRYGNVARFINHSCCPNLLPVKVFVDHQDLRFPRIAFFASRDIAADEELGYEHPSLALSSTF